MVEEGLSFLRMSFYLMARWERMIAERRLVKMRVEEWSCSLMRMLWSLGSFEERLDFHQV